MVIRECFSCGERSGEIFEDQACSELFVQCLNCGAAGPRGKSRLDAIDVWNKVLRKEDVETLLKNEKGKR